MNPRLLIALAIGGILLFLAWRSRSAAAQLFPGSWGEEYTPGAYAPVGAPEAPGEAFLPWEEETGGYWPGTYPALPAPAYEEIPMPTENAAAFLRLIRRAEGTERSGLDPYAQVYGYAFTIADFSAHPAELGWGGGRLSDEMCRAAGFAPGCVSTAAGAYQFNRPTWREFAVKAGVADFSPASQDAAAMALLGEIGALAAVEAGDLDRALRLASSRWASLPYSTAEQPRISVAEAAGIFAEGGGTTA